MSSSTTATLERRWTHDPRENLQRLDLRTGRVVRAKAGPWWDEPDKVQWVDPATGYDCLINRNQMGAWCGYVGLPPGHPWRGAGSYSQIDATVHGGLTFGPRPCDEGAPEGHGICHVPFPGRPADVEWLGFDCGHAFDLSPVMATLYDDEELFPPHSRPEWMREVYRDEAYVRHEVEQLAAQAAEAARNRSRHGYVKRARDERRRRQRELVALLANPPAAGVPVRRRRAAAPPAPVNVRVVLADGREIPCELVYDGWHDGAHQWRAVTPVDVDLLLGAEVAIDELPGKTAVTVEMAHG